MAQVNTEDGYVAVGVAGEAHVVEVGNIAEQEEASVVLNREDIVTLRAMLWDAIRKQERGFDISIDDVLKIEEVRSKGRYSVSGYAEEIEWTIALLQRHLERIAGWQDAPDADRGMFGKLDEFLSEFEEM